MIFTQREKDLIIKALYILECQCIGDELHFEIKNELGGTPSDDEVRELMERFEN
jgi:hypothetical protein